MENTRHWTAKARHSGLVRALCALVAIGVAFSSSAQEAPPDETAGWTAIGPQRGHVIDAAVSRDQVAVATRVGVMVADLAGEDAFVWHRDPRFPKSTRRLVVGEDGTWWSTAQSAACRISDEGTTCIEVPDQCFPVDIGAVDADTAIVAVRGQAPGLFRVSTDGTIPSVVLAGVEPWSIAVRGGQVWAGTLGQGLWVSEDGGRTFSMAIRDASVSALEFVGETLAMGLRDGSIEDPIAGTKLGTVGPDWALDFAAAGEQILVLSESADGPQALWRQEGSSFAALLLPVVDDDPSQLNLTGLWTLPGGAVLVGTFRRGPIIYEAGKFRTARQDFRASNVTGTSHWGDSLMVAMMGTGVYLSDAELEHWTGLCQFPGPVTDTVALSEDAGAIIATDFDGIVRFDASGHWTRFNGVRDPAAHAPNGLIDVRADGEGRWWGITPSKRLMLHQNQGWEECSERGALRLDGEGEHLVLLTTQGFYTLDSCDKPGKKAWPDVRLPQVREEAFSDGGWLAVPGALYRDSQQVAELPRGKIEALTGGVDEALVVIDHAVLICGDGACARVGVPFGERSSGVGWLADGRIWYAEAMGTVWASGGDAIPLPFSSVVASSRPGETPWPLLRLPWSMEGQRAADQQQHQDHSGEKPPPETEGGGDRSSLGIYVVAGGLIVLLLAAVWMFVNSRRKPDSEPSDS